MQTLLAVAWKGVIGLWSLRLCYRHHIVVGGDISREHPSLLLKPYHPRITLLWLLEAVKTFRYGGFQPQPIRQVWFCSASPPLIWEPRLPVRTIHVGHLHKTVEPRVSTIRNPTRGGPRVIPWVGMLIALAKPGDFLAMG